MGIFKFYRNFKLFKSESVVMKLFLSTSAKVESIPELIYLTRNFYLV
jgi:hypothetical protein